MAVAHGHSHARCARALGVESWGRLVQFICPPALAGVGVADAFADADAAGVPAYADAAADALALADAGADALLSVLLLFAIAQGHSHAPCARAVGVER